MPSKRPSPLEEPPSASSASDESEEIEAEEEEDESDEEEEEEEEEQQTASVKPSVKKTTSNSKPNSAATPVPQPRSVSGSDEESESGSDADSEDSPEKSKASAGASRGADPNIKPISSKPMNDNAKSKKSAPAPANAAATPTKPTSSSKRSLEFDKSEKESKQKKKKKKSDDAGEEDGHTEENDKKQGEDPRKLFQRLWSDEDEIVILKGMLSYQKQGLNPNSNLNAFLDSIKSSLHVDVSRTQLNSKLQRLKQKYMNQASKAKNGQDPNFSKPHDMKSFQLSKKIWGRMEGKEEGAEANNGGRDSATTDVKKSKSGKTGNMVVSSQPKVPAAPEHHGEVPETVEEEQWLSLAQFGKNLTMPPPVLGDFVAKEGLGLLGSSKAKEFDQRWKKLLVAETKIYLQRLDLAREYTKSVLDELESSNP